MGVDQVQYMAREESRRKSLENVTEKSNFIHAFLAEIHPGKLPWNTIMEVWKMTFLSFRDPNQNLHFHERIHYIVMASQPRPH